MQRIAYSTQRGIVYLPVVKTSRAPLPPGNGDARRRTRRHRRVKVVVTHKRAQRIVGQMKRARRMTHRIALRIADIDQYRRLLMQFLVRFFNIDAFKLFHDSLLFLVMTGDGRPNFTL